MLPLLLLFSATSSYGQASCYVPDIYSSTYTPISGGTLLGTGTLDDNGFTGNIGFNFVFNGNTYTQVGISANGFITFGGTAPPTNPRTFINSTLNNGVSGFSRDLQGSSSTATMRMETVGTSPNRRCVIQWSDWGDFPTSAGDSYDFQIILYESNNVIEVRYGAMIADNNVTGDVGIKDASNGASFKNIAIGTNTWATAQNVTATTTGGSQTATLAATFTPPSGLTFRWVRLTSLTAGFSAPDTVYTGELIDLINTNPQGFSHTWDVDGNNSTDYSTTNVKFWYSTPGSYNVRLISQNCGLIDSFKKTIVVRTPTSPPKVDFIASVNDAQLYENVTLIDLSDNGPTAWGWEVFDLADSAGTRLTDAVLNGTNPLINRRPLLNFVNPGVYSVCLTTSNSIGAGTRICKYDYITITEINKISMGPVTNSTLLSGTLYDNGGIASNYSNITNTNTFLINPCGADSIKLKFASFKFGSGDLLKIYDGYNVLGKPLHTGNGYGLGNLPPAQIVATSGALYLYFTSDASGTDSGFIANWTTVKAPVLPPFPGFISPDTVFTKGNYKYINTTVGKGTINYSWLVDNSPVTTSTDMVFAFNTPGTYTIRLEATSCLGDSGYEKTVVVIDPNRKVAVDFFANEIRPNVGEKDTFNSVHDFATNFVWTFSPNTIEFVDGTSQTSENPVVRFLQPGPYSVTLTAWHVANQSLTQRIITKQNYVIAIRYCIPGAINNSTDIGISRVVLSRGSETYFDNSTASGSGNYTDYTSTHQAELTFGGTYDISISRSTNVNPMSRKVWIDFNIDGDFTDANELVVFESMSNSSTFNGSFRIPALDSAFKGQTTMRVGVGYGATANNPCGTNLVGEFEDYMITLVTDDGPTIELIDDDTIYVEEGSNFNDPWALALDATEGDISSRITVDSDLDMNAEGIYFATYTIKDASNNKASVSRVIVVKFDATAPVLTLVGSDTVYVDVFTLYTEPGASAMDNKDGNLTGGINISGTVNSSITGTYIITYSVGDARGNVSTRKRVVIVRDNVKPVIHQLKSDNVQIFSVFVEDEYIQVTDNYDQLITYKRSGPTVNTSAIGNYTVIYTAVDAAGNIADTVIRVYKVNDFIAPVINFPFIEDTLLVDVFTLFKIPNVIITDNFYSSDQMTLSSSGTVNTSIIGNYKITYTASDPSGNTATRVLVVRVVDRVAPTLSSQPLYVKTNTNYNPMAGLTVNDNYYPVGVMLPLVQVASYNVNIYKPGTYFINYVVTDPSGNTSAVHSRLVFVSDDYDATGVKEEEKISLKLYPNPVSQYLNIDYKATAETSRIEIYNSVGERLYSNEINKLEGSLLIDLSAYSNGVYFVKMLGSDFVKTERIVINK